MFEAMRQAAFLGKLVEHDPTAASAQTVLEMATIGGARALGLGDRLGSLEAGKLADVIVVSMNSARQTPLYNPVSHLVYVTRGDDVRTTIVNGRILMRDRRVLDAEQPGRARAGARDGQEGAGGGRRRRPPSVEHREIGQVPVHLRVVEAVADDEPVLDREPDVVDLDVDHAA